MRLNDSINCIWGVGSITSNVFRSAGFTAIRDIVGQPVAQKIQIVIDRMKQENQTLDDTYWKRLAERCNDVVYRACNFKAKQIDPEHFLCPITLQLMEDPVITPAGHTYERKAITQYIYLYSKDFISQGTLDMNEVYDNIALRHAIEDYRNHYQMFSTF